MLMELYSRHLYGIRSKLFVQVCSAHAKGESDIVSVE